jgi:hypothetical protein
MKKNAMSFFAIILLMAFVLAVNSCSKEDLNGDEGLASELKSGVTASASGHGLIIDYPEVGLKRQFTFHAKIMPDGSVSGSGIISYTSGELMSSFDINCMTIHDNIAYLAGINIKNTLNPEYEGKGCYFVVQDNGEEEDGTLLTPDIICLMYVNLPILDCESYFANYGYPPAFYIEGGNIQVKP